MITVSQETAKKLKKAGFKSNSGYTWVCNNKSKWNLADKTCLGQIGKYRSDIPAPTAEEILNELQLSDKPRITVLNKIDLVLDENHDWNEDTAIEYLSGTVEAAENTVFISAFKKWGLTGLRELIGETITRNQSVENG